MAVLIVASRADRNNVSCSLTETRDAYYVMDCSRRPELAPDLSALVTNESAVYPILTLNLSQNNMGVIPQLRRLPFLENLILSQNLIEVISPSLLHGETYPSLKNLALNVNHISSVKNRSFSGLSNLETLSLNGNHIQSIESGAFFALRRLMELRLGNNFLHTLPDSLFNYTLRLEQLDITHNRLEKVYRWFRNIASLQKLDLSSNYITYIDDSAFQGLTNLRELILAGNLIDHLSDNIFRDLHRLEVLHLNNNRLKVFSIGTFSYIVTLQQLDLSYNRLATFLVPESEESETNITSLLFLETLDLSDNPFTNLPNELFGRTPALRTLTMKNVRALEFLPDMAGLQHLTKLNVRYSGIKKIFGCDVNSMPQLQLLLWRGSPVQCDCDLRWLLSWIQTAEKMRDEVGTKVGC